MGSLGSTNPSNLEALAEACLQEAKTLNEIFAVKGYGRLGFDAQALSSFPKDDEKTQHARNNLRNAAKALYDMATGPQECLTESSLTSVSRSTHLKHLKSELTMSPASIRWLHEIPLPLQRSGFCA